MRTSARVRKANQASAFQLLQCLLNFTSHTTHKLRIFHAEELESEDKDAVWSLFEVNMQSLASQLYLKSYRVSSFGWNPTSKRDELFHKLSRFILIKADEELVAFSMFRFEFEDKENLLYCYDLQICPSHQRTGLGKLLMQMLESIGSEWGMKKVMLTVFKANENAIQFYRMSGFTMDESCPGYSDECTDTDCEDVDYEILSKRLPCGL